MTITQSSGLRNGIQYTVSIINPRAGESSITLKAQKKMTNKGMRIR